MVYRTTQKLLNGAKYSTQNGTPDNLEEVARRKKVIEERQKKIDICLNCKKVCKTGICEFFPHG